MRTLTEEVENKQQYIKTKAALLREYKSYAKDLEYAEDTFDEGLILEKREKLARQIRDLGAQIRKIEAMENPA